MQEEKTAPEAEGEDPLDAAIREASAEIAGRGDAPEEAPPEESPEPKEEAPEAPEAEAAGDDVEIPQHWSAEERTKWEALPPEHKALLLDARKSLEAGYNRKSQKLSEKQRYWKEIKQTFQPLAPILQQSGATKLQAIRNLVNAQMALQSQPDAAFEHLARNFAASRPEDQRKAILTRFARGLGVNPGAAQKPQAQDDYLDPVAGQQIAQLRQQLSQLSQGMTQQTALAQQQAIANAQTLIDDFKAKNPLFAEVEEGVKQLLASPLVPQNLPPAQRLEKAYNLAIRLDDEVSKRVEAEKKAARAKEDAAKRRQENEQSKRAARNPEGQPVTAARKDSGDLDEIIKEAMGQAA